MKLSSWYIFHAQTNYIFILVDFLTIISYRFYSKYAEVSVAYIGTSCSEYLDVIHVVELEIVIIQD